MRIAGEPRTTTARNATTGQYHDIVVANLVMDAPEDNGRTTAWYWMPADANAEPGYQKDLKRWREAVVAERGPHRSAQNAMSSVGHYTNQAANLAQRLNEAAELVRIGHLENGLESTLEWLRAAHEIDVSVALTPAGTGDPEERDADSVRKSGQVADANIKPPEQPAT